MAENELEGFYKELDTTYTALLAVVDDLNKRLDTLAEQNAQLDMALTKREKSLARLLAEDNARLN